MTWGQAGHPVIPWVKPDIQSHPGRSVTDRDKPDIADTQSQSGQAVYWYEGDELREGTLVSRTLLR